MAKASINNPASGRLHDKLSAKSRARRDRTTQTWEAERMRDGVPRRNDLRPELEQVERAPSELKFPKVDVRNHEPAHIAEIVASIKAFGFVGRVVIDTDETVLDGVSLVLAARSLGLDTVPCLRVHHLSASASKAFRVAVNRLGERGTWDVENLALVFEELVDVDEPIIGFEEEEIDILLQDEADEAPLEDPVALVGSAPVRAKRGSLVILGEHRVFCADAKEAISYEVLMAGEKARVVIADPPYNVKIGGHVSGLGQTVHREFLEGSGELTSAEFESFLARSIAAASEHVVEGGLLGVFMDWRGIGVLLAACGGLGLELINLVVWSKTAGMGSLWRSAHELMPWFKRGRAPHVNNVELGRHGRWRKNVWEYPGASAMGSEAREGLAYHPTAKSTQMIEDAILDVSHRGEIVLDPFLGSGTTLLAAERSGRRCYGLEIDPLYVDVIIRRWEEQTGGEAIVEDVCGRLEAHESAPRDLPSTEVASEYRRRANPDQVVDLTGVSDDQR